MVHVGLVTGCYTYSPPVRDPYWSSGGWIQTIHFLAGLEVARLVRLVRLAKLARLARLASLAN